MEHQNIKHLDWRIYMRLHHNPDEFLELVELTSKKINIPAIAVRKDYFITIILNNLEESDFADKVVFKGGTSLSKCYPKSIERFSEDIDLTFIPEEGLSNKQISKKLKNIEKTLIGEGNSEIVSEERNDRNKSSYVWFSEEYKEMERIKLEIGSSVRPHPYEKRVMKSYIHEYLKNAGEEKAIAEFQLKDVSINVLNVERTFVDKIMSVKRHAICGTLSGKTRHLYDIVKLIKLPEIQRFLENEEQLKTIIRITKETDSFYLEKRNISKDYNPLDEYAFERWKERFSKEIVTNYESLHKTLLFTDRKQDWNEVLMTFERINKIFEKIGE